MGLVDLLLLADGRAPLGAYAHSFGLESSIAAGDVHDVWSLERFVDARLRTAGRTDATAAAAVRHRMDRPGWGATRGPGGAAVTAGSGGGSSDGNSVEVPPAVPDWLTDADRELEARLIAPALRETSRALGRHLLRLARRTWPDPCLDRIATSHPDGLHQPVVLGVVGAVIGAGERDVAVASLYGLASAVASAGLRLLGLDPLEVHALQARLAATIDLLAHDAAALAAGALEELPMTGSPLADVRAQHHASEAGTHLFAT